MTLPISYGLTPHVLLVEDDDDDAFLAREGLAEAGLKLELHRVSDGAECLDFLRRQGRHEEAPRPDLILLDLNMPVMDGREVLIRKREDPALVSIPVVVLTTSSSATDIAESYLRGANAYVVKPSCFSAFVTAMRALGDFWFQTTRLPGPSASSR